MAWSHILIFLVDDPFLTIYIPLGSPESILSSSHDDGYVLIGLPLISYTEVPFILKSDDSPPIVPTERSLFGNSGMAR